MRFYLLSVLAAVLLLTPSCASVLVYKSSRAELQRERCFVNSKANLPAPTMGEVLAYRPGRQIAAGAVDLVTAGAAYYLTQGNSSDSGDKSDDDTTTINVEQKGGEGSGNQTLTVVVGDHNSAGNTTTTTTDNSDNSRGD